MKTIEQAALEYAKNVRNAFEKDGVNFDSSDELFCKKDFQNGAAFAEEWISVNDELPICYETGNWDGKRSDFVLAKDDDGDWYKARVYEGIMDGNHYLDWFSSEDYELIGIIEWRPINRKVV